MSSESQLEDLLKTPGALTIAIDPSGGAILPWPPGLSRHRAEELTGDNPLDPITPASQGRAVVAFEAARRKGHGAALVDLVLGGPTRRLDIYNLESKHGCFIVVAVPAADSGMALAGEARLAPRQATYELNATGVFIGITDEFTQMVGWSAEELLGQSSLEIIHPDDHEDGIVAWVELLESPSGQSRLRQRFRQTTGEWLWCEVTDTNRLDDVDRPHVLAEVLDVSRELAAQAALQERETLLDRLTQALPTGVLHLDADGKPGVCNDRWQELTGLSPTEGSGALAAAVAETGAVTRARAQANDAGVDADLEVTFTADDAVCRFGELHLRPLGNDGHSKGLLVTLDDVTDLRTYQHELASQARRDPLTGVLNRLGIEEAVEASLQARAEADDEYEIAVLFLDLDRFKVINDSHGHAVGDEVLRAVSEMVGGLLRPGDVVGRLGGDEFLVLLSGPDARAQSEAVAKRIRAATPEIGRRMADDIHVGVSIGLAEAVEYDDFDGLLKRADDLMYERKRRRDDALYDSAAPTVRSDHHGPDPRPSHRP